MAKEANQGIADDAANKAKQAVKVARDTAKAAQAVGKAAAKAAQGRYAEAALDLLKNETTRKIIVILALVPALLLVFAMMALPSMLFGTIMEFLNNVAEAISNFFEAIGEWFEGVATYFQDLLVDFATTVAKSICNLLGIPTAVDDEGEEDDVNSMSAEELLEEYVDDNEAYVMYKGDSGTSTTEERAAAINNGDDAVYDTLDMKLKFTRKKLKYRMKEIRSAVYGVSYYREAYGDTVEGEKAIRYVLRKWLWDSPTEKAQIFRDADMHKIIINVSMQDYDQEAAIQLLSLYTVMTGADPRDVELLTLVNWLGYKEQLYAVGNDGPATTADGKLHVMQIEVFNDGGYVLTAEIQGLGGTFMPSYLVEQLQQEKVAIMQKYLDLGEEAFVREMAKIKISTPPKEGEEDWTSLSQTEAESKLSLEIAEHGGYKAYLRDEVSGVIDDALAEAYAPFGMGAMDLLITTSHQGAEDIIVNPSSDDYIYPSTSAYQHIDPSFEYTYTYEVKVEDEEPDPDDPPDDEPHPAEEGEKKTKTETRTGTATFTAKTPRDIELIASGAKTITNVPQNGEFVAFTSAATNKAKRYLGIGTGAAKDASGNYYDGVYYTEDLPSGVSVPSQFQTTSITTGQYIVEPVGDQGDEFFVTPVFNYMCFSEGDEQIYYYKRDGLWFRGTRTINLITATAYYQINIGLRDFSALSTVVGLWTDRATDPAGGTTTIYD